jgi:hypothetical protein
MRQTTNFRACPDSEGTGYALGRLGLRLLLSLADQVRGRDNGADQQHKCVGFEHIDIVRGTALRWALVSVESTSLVKSE